MREVEKIVVFTSQVRPSRARLKVVNVKVSGLLGPLLADEREHTPIGEFVAQPIPITLVVSIASRTMFPAMRLHRVAEDSPSKGEPVGVAC
jgi:hypothetical protein